MIDVLGMIAEAREVAPASKVHQAEPGLVRHGEEKMAGADLDETGEITFRVRQMLEHLRGEHEVEAGALRRKREDVARFEREARMAGARLGDGVGAEIDADIAFEGDAAREQPVEQERLAAPEIENARRGERR